MEPSTVFPPIRPNIRIIHKGRHFSPINSSPPYSSSIKNFTINISQILAKTLPTIKYHTYLMYSPRPIATSLHPRAATKLLQTVHAISHGSGAASLKACSASLLVRQPQISPCRFFTSTASRPFKEVFPPPTDAPSIKVTPPAWHHPV